MTYRSDEEAKAYKRIADLEDENRKLRSQTSSNKTPWKFPEIKLEKVVLWLLSFAALIVVAGLIYAALYCVYHKTVSSDQIEYCYIEEVASYDKSPVYELVGYRSWTNNICISRHDTIINAYKAAEMLKCPLLRK
jgi:hypothetical protein